MTTYTCSMPSCDTEYSAGERDRDSLFVSFSISPHDVEDVQKRAVAVCADCGRDLAAAFPEVDDV